MEHSHPMTTKERTSSGRVLIVGFTIIILFGVVVHFAVPVVVDFAFDLYVKIKSQIPGPLRH